MKRESWVQTLFRPLAIAGMMGCLALSVVHLIRLFFPDWSGTYMVAGSVLAAIEAAYSRRLIRARNIRGPELRRFRAVEIALLFILVLIGSIVGIPWDELHADLRIWLQSPLQLLDLEVAFALAVTLASWGVANQTAYDLDRIGEGPVGGSAYVHPVDALTGRFFQGGALLLVVAGITRVGIASVLQARRPSVPGLVLNVLVYFALGLAMLGQIQFSRLSKRWREEGTEVASRLTGDWARNTLLLLGVAALIAFMLPTGYTLSLLEVASLVIGALLYAFNLVFHLLILALFLVLRPLARLFGADVAGQPAAPASPQVLPPVAPGGCTPDWFGVVKSVALWTATLVGVAYVVRSYLRDRPELANSLASLKPFRKARQFLVGLWRRLALWAGALRRRIPARLRSRRSRPELSAAPGGGRFGFVRLTGLSPRERTLYYYLSILRRAGQRGYPRQDSETPYEYETKLGPNIPQVEEELDRMTDAFVETRYSAHGVGRDQLARVREDWRKISAALRAPRKSGGAGETPGR